MTLPFRQTPRHQKRPVCAITQNLVSWPGEFCLPLCHATYEGFSNDAHDMSYRHQAGEVTKRDSPTGEQKANRNTCQFRNPRISITTKDITFSNRNTKPVSANGVFHIPGSRSTNHDSRITARPLHPAQMRETITFY